MPEAPGRERLWSFADLRHSVSLRLAGAILLFSAAASLVLTLLHVYIDYRREVAALELRLEQIHESYLSSLAEGLWTLDEKQLQLQLQGILRLPDTRSVEVRETDSTDHPFVVKLGKNSQDPVIAREYPLRHDVLGQDKVIGTVRVEATLAGIYRGLLDRALSVLASQAATIFLVALFSIYIARHLVTRHLSGIANFVDSYRISDPPQHLRLHRPPRPHEDELQRVVTAFNAMTNDLHKAYRDLQDVNDELARDVAARRQAEAVLREREARIHRLVDANIIGVFIANREGNITEANDGFLQMVGYDREDLVAGRLRWTDLTPPEWGERTARAVAELAATGIIQPYEKEHFRKDGSRMPVLIGTASLGETGDERVTFVLDLTERKRVEDELRASEARFRTFVDHATDAFMLHGEDGTVLDVNRHACESLGYSRDELVGAAPAGFDPDVHAAQLEPILRRLDAGEIVTFESRHRRKDGTVFPVEVRVREFRQGDRRLAISLTRDITERKRVEEALRESEEQWKAVFENNPTMYFMVDAAGIILSVNPFGAEQLGYRPDELLGRPVQDLFQEADREFVQQNSDSCLEQLGQSHSWEVRKLRKDGAVLWVRETARAMLIKKQPILLIACEDVTERKRAAEAARRSEEELRDVIETIPAMVWSALPDGAVDFVNRHWRDYSGISREETSGWIWKAAIQPEGLEPAVHPDDLERYLGEWRASLATGQPFKSEVRFRRAVDSEFRWFLENAVPLRDVQGNVLKWYGFVTDIEDRKRAEEAARRSEDELRRLIENVPVKLFVASPGPSNEFTSRRWRQYTGLSEEETVGSGWQSAVHPDDLARHLGKWRLCSATGEPFEDEARFRRAADGVYHWFLLRAAALRDAAGNMLKWYGVLIDIEDRKRAEEALRRSERYLAEAQRLSHTGSWAYEPATGNTNYWSEEMFRIFGLDPQQSSPPDRTEFSQFLLPEDPQGFYEGIYGEKAEYEKDHRIMLPDGTVKHLYVIGHPVLDEIGEVVEYIGTSMDVTERKRAEAEAREAERRLREVQTELAHANRVATMGQLTASIAHEVRQPLAAALANAQAALRWLDARPSNLEEARQALGRIVRDARHAGEVVARIRALAEKAPPRRDELDLNEAIGEVLALSQGEAAKAGVAVRTQLAEALPRVRGDRVQLQQVVLNLIINALDALRGVHAGPRALLVGSEAAAGGVAVVVCDTGPGLEPARLERLFEAFYTTKPGGLGMGLAICRSIIEAHGGRLWAEANQPRGAMFRFTLPVEGKVPEGPRAEGSLSAPSDDDAPPASVVQV